MEFPAGGCLDIGALEDTGLPPPDDTLALLVCHLNERKRRGPRGLDARQAVESGRGAAAIGSQLDGVEVLSVTYEVVVHGTLHASR